MAKVKLTKKEEEAEKLRKFKEYINKKYDGNNVPGSYISVPTRSLALNKASNSNGTPMGKLIEVFGPYSSGKSTYVYETMAQFQRCGHVVMLLDYEHAFDIVYAKSIGINVEEIIFKQPDTMEDGYNMIYDTVKSGLVKLIVIDSHTSMNPADTLKEDSEIGDAKMMLEARINSQSLRKIKPLLSSANVTIIGISQLRVTTSRTGGTNEPTGGNAWKFYADQRIKLWRKSDKDNETDTITFEYVKNKCGKPFGKCEIDILYGEGFDYIGEIIRLAVELGIIKRAGSWFSYLDSNIGQGKQAVKQLFKDNPDFYKEIRDKVNKEYIKIEDEFTIPENIVENELTDLIADELEDNTK